MTESGDDRILLGERYELGGLLGRGGMADVRVARDLRLGRTVAIKQLRADLSSDDTFQARFRREAQSAAALNHPSIVAVYDTGESTDAHGNHIPYIVMEYVEGQTLREVLRDDRKILPERSLSITADVLSALDYSHRSGIIHRDIKPANVMLTPSGQVKVMDFGIARAIADSSSAMTQTAAVIGTVQYLSPEQASGHPASPTTDIYSLGIVAYESLAGKRPFTGESQVAIAMAQINEAPPELPVTVPEPVRNLVFSMIAKSPAERPSTAAHVARAAQALRRGDIATATVAVPAIAEGVDINASTRLMGATAAQDDATMLLAAGGGISNTAPVPLGDGEDGDPEKKKRSPWTWPLVGLVVILVVVLIAALWPLLTPSAAPTSAPPTTASNTPTPSQTSEEPSETPTTETVTVNEGDFIGLAYEDAAVELARLGLNPVKKVGAAAATADQVDTVSAVAPRGNVDVGTTIELTVYGPLPTVEAPSESATFQGACGAGGCQVTAGEQYTVSWPAYSQCPSGTSVTGYTVSIQDGTVTTPAGTNAQAVVTIDDDATNVVLSYTVTCGSSTSPSSPSTSATVIPVDTGNGNEGEGGDNGNGNGGNGNG